MARPRGTIGDTMDEIIARPPKVLRSKFVYDQNRYAVMGEVVAEEELP